MKSDVFTSAPESAAADPALLQVPHTAVTLGDRSCNVPSPAGGDVAPIPWRVRWNWVCRHWLPNLIFLIAVVFAASLWQRQTGRLPIAGEVQPSGRSIITYVQRDQRIRPGLGMLVQVRLCSDPTRVFDSTIREVGTQVQAVPKHLSRNPAIEEFGLPVQVAVPPSSDLRPGEQVDVLFRRSSR